MDYNTIAGCLFGAALGDAIAAPTEFLSLKEIHHRFGPQGPDLTGHTYRVTDDTQMMIAVAEAMLDSGAELDPKVAETELIDRFVDWLNDPENNRAPGQTCISACKKLDKDIPWPEATVMRSKGCGANMRVQPIGLLPGSATQRAGLAQLQSALTHGHPTALAASDLTAFAIHFLATGGSPLDVVEAMITYAKNQREVYHQDLLGELWRKPWVKIGERKTAVTRIQAADSGQFIAFGWDECLAVLHKLQDAAHKADRIADPCVSCGEGWIAEEALATGLLCFLLFPNDPKKAIQRAAVTEGDSDSIACLTGAFAGAHLGLKAWPASDIAGIEYRDTLTRISMGLTDFHQPAHTM